MTDLGLGYFRVGNCLFRAAVGASQAAHGSYLRGGIWTKERLAKEVKGREEDTE